MKNILWASFVLVSLAALLTSQRHWVVFSLLAEGSPPELLAPMGEGENVRWHDDYFIVQILDPQTFAIGEPRYQQENFNYLILGSNRAILFDAGPGLRDIRPVAKELTDLPITFVPSHFHYDHIGNEITFDHVAVADLPHIRERAQGDELQLKWREHLGSAEGYDAPLLEIDEWLSPGTSLDLGERKLTILYTPGHTDDSISLLDSDAGYLFSGDFIYPGPLYAFLPNSRMGDYQQAAKNVLDVADSSVRIFGAHRMGPPGAPEQTLSDVSDLRRALNAIKTGELDGEGFYPVTYIVSPTMQILAEPSWLQDWGARYPEFGNGQN